LPLPKAVFLAQQGAFIKEMPLLIVLIEAFSGILKVLPQEEFLLYRKQLLIDNR